MRSCASLPRFHRWCKLRRTRRLHCARSSNAAPRRRACSKQPAHGLPQSGAGVVHGFQVDTAAVVWEAWDCTDFHRILTSTQA